MSTEPLADVQDVVDIWRPLSDAESATVGRLIDKASAKLRHACPFDIDARIALFETDPTQPTALDPSVVADRVASIVKRFLVNPDGAVSASRSAGPFSESTTYVNRYDKGGADVRGELQITEGDIDALRPSEPTEIPFTVELKPRSPQQMTHETPLVYDAYRGRIFW